MRVAHARLTPFRLALRRPLVTAHGRLDTRDGWLLELSSDAGVHGWGEATPLAGFRLETTSAAGRALARVADFLVGRRIDSLEDCLDGVEGLTAGEPAARAAADVALHDLTARAGGVSIATWLRGGASRPEGPVPVAALLAGATESELACHARSLVDQDFATLKLKVGAVGLDGDEANLSRVRAAAGADVALRIDANGGWKEADAIRALQRLAVYDLEFAEQPIPAGDVAALARVRAASSVPIAADESVAGEAAASELIAGRAVDLLVLKLASAGGLRPAFRIARRAACAGVRVVVTSLLDGAIGRAAALQLAAALPAPQPASGLATGALLRDDLAPPLTVNRSAMALPEESGLGGSPERDALERNATGKSRVFEA